MPRPIWYLPSIGFPLCIQQGSDTFQKLKLISLNIVNIYEKRIEYYMRSIVSYMYLNTDIAPF